MRFALNHIATPGLDLDDFLAMAARLGISAVEIRNDLPDLVGTMPAENVKSAAEKAGVEIVAINALYPFNVWSGDLPGRAEALADYAATAGAKALVMCPLNEGTEVPFDDLVFALEAMKPILEDRGLTGLVEPLGFPISSLRHKSEAIAAIVRAGGEGTYRLVHDTFHHHLAGETEYFADWTGLVHISGVTDLELDTSEMLDEHRVLVNAEDRLGNIEQIKALEAAGYRGVTSFEPFSPQVHDHPDPEAALTRSMAFVAALDSKGR